MRYAMNTTYRYVLFIISVIIMSHSLDAYSQEKNNKSFDIEWRISDDVDYYRSIEESKAPEFGAIPAYLTNAMAQSEYAMMLHKIESIAKNTPKWLLIQEISINNSFFSAIFLIYLKTIISFIAQQPNTSEGVLRLLRSIFMLKTRKE